MQHHALYGYLLPLFLRIVTSAPTLTLLLLAVYPLLLQHPCPSTRALYLVPVRKSHAYRTLRLTPATQTDWSVAVAAGRCLTRNKFRTDSVTLHSMPRVGTTNFLG
jgi:hypothetical protein